MFVRFVVTDLDRDSGRRQGLFQAADALQKSGALSSQDSQRIEEIYSWFRQHLKVPDRLAVSRRPHRKAQAISWFRDTATFHIAKMREFQEVIERHGIPVQMIKGRRVGYVLYEDEFQVVAYPFSETEA